MCSGCPYDCFTCDANKNCLSCSFDDSRTLSNNRCIPLAGYFDNSTQKSAKCLGVCSTCRSITYCMSCVTGYYLRSDNKCYSTCLPSFYADSKSLTCKACPQACALCLNFSYCQMCVNGNYLRVDYLCYPTCLERYFPDCNKLTCSKCPYDCFTCNDNGTCINCNALSDFR